MTKKRNETKEETHLLHLTPPPRSKSESVCPTLTTITEEGGRGGERVREEVLVRSRLTVQQYQSLRFLQLAIADQFS